MPFDVSAVSNDIWHDIASISDIEEVLSLEATCKFFREVVSNKISWLERLRALDQAHAPDLPHHVSVDDLPWQDLRNLVVRAQRRHRNSTGSAPLRPTHTTTISIRLVVGPTLDMELLPGGALLLVLLFDGDLQCWSVPGGECVWSHRNDARYNTDGMIVSSFAYDMQTNGNVHVLAISDGRDRERTVAIFQIPPRRKPACRPGTSLLGKLLKRLQISPPPIKYNGLLYNDAPKELEDTDFFSNVGFAKLSGDILAVSVGNDLLVTFWGEERSVLIRGCSCNDVQFVDGYLIGVFGHQENRSIIAFWLSSIRNVQPRTSAPGVTQILSLERDIPHASCRTPRILGSYGNDAKLSICTFHWKPEAKRKQKGISITMSVDILSQETGQIFSVLDSFLLEIPAVTAGPNARLPSITHTVRPGTIILDLAIDNYGSASRPSQAGSVVIKTKYDREDVFVLATASCEGGVVYHTLNMPRARGAKVEFYSGAVYSATKVSHLATDIVIQYLD